MERVHIEGLWAENTKSIHAFLWAWNPVTGRFGETSGSTPPQVTMEVMIFSPLFCKGFLGQMVAEGSTMAPLVMWHQTSSVLTTAQGRGGVFFFFFSFLGETAGVQSLSQYCPQSPLDGSQLPWRQARRSIRSTPPFNSLRRMDARHN